ncbi:MAG: hypothetical protein ACPGXK_14225 [Phycisphaerae bacterium]
MRGALLAFGLLGFSALGLAFLSFPSYSVADDDAARAKQERRSRDAFSEVARVLRHPRCLNCHPSGDRPHVGDERRVHGMNVQRGADNHGMAGLRCHACHQDENQDLAGVPGAPHWHLAPLSMGWEGLDDHDLASRLIDRSQNGDRSFEQLLEHMSHDPLVGWAWEPGVGRAAPPLSRDEFIQALKTWFDTGAVLPRKGKTSF